MAIKRNCKSHLTDYRMERVSWIIDNIGLGDKIIAEREWTDTSGKVGIRQLTDTGVIICRTKDTNEVVTMFVATILQVKAMYFGKIANWVYKMAVRNEKIVKEKNYPN